MLGALESLQDAGETVSVCVRLYLGALGTFSEHGVPFWIPPGLHLGPLRPFFVTCWYILVVFDVFLFVLGWSFGS